MKTRTDAAGTAARWLLAPVVIAVAGCSTLQPPLRSNLSSDDPRALSCATWYTSLEQVIDEAGVRDAGAYRVPGYPYLRVDRLLTSLRGSARSDPRAYGEWVDRMRALDADARAYEIGNLPGSGLIALGAARKEDIIARTDRCAGDLRRIDLEQPSNRERLLDAAAMPDEYLTWQRVLGLYALSRIPFSRGVERWYEEARERFRRSREGATPAQPVARYAPPLAVATPRESISGLLSRASRSSLGIEEFRPDERELLFSAYAPVFEVETGGSYDRPGALLWKDGPAPEVDSSRPVVYRRLAHTRYDGHTLVQLVYTMWFSERPRDHPFDLLAGRLDGLTWRVTLAPDGEPLVYDTIHPCGCFHMFFPTPRVAPVEAPDPSEEWAFVPATLPRVAPGERLRVRLATRTHYVIDVGIDPGGRSQPYAYLEEDSLRSLPAAGRASRSAFGPDGLVPGTERNERMFFWPMGIPSAGAMRQWGRHATAFVGRRHFDDADLIEKRFRVLPQ